MTKKKETEEVYWVDKETKPEEEGDGEAQNYESDKELE